MIASRPSNDTSLLELRMVALDLDPYELGRAEAALVGHLQRRCMQCESWRRCQSDLAGEAAGSDARDCRQWLEYCPNAPTLEMLHALQDSRKVVVSYSFPYLW